jgi:hypothetical protein
MPHAKILIRLNFDEYSLGGGQWRKSHRDWISLGDSAEPDLGILRKPLALPASGHLTLIDLWEILEICDQVLSNDPVLLIEVPVKTNLKISSAQSILQNILFLFQA